MKLVIHPELDAHRLKLVCSVNEELVVVNAESPESALAEIKDADGFYGKITPDLLSAST